jgi:hypothetical protein
MGSAKSTVQNHYTTLLEEGNIFTILDRPPRLADSQMNQVIGKSLKSSDRNHPMKSKNVEGYDFLK